MNKLLAVLLLTTMTGSAFAEVQEQAHYSLKGFSQAAAPQVLRDHTRKSPELVKQGSPKIVANAPENRQKELASSIQFDEPSQCYSVARNLIDGDNFVVEAWVKPAKDKDESWHTVVANGDGGSGFLIAQHDDRWVVLVGSVGAANLGEVYADEWTHLAVVKSQGAVTGWLNGKRVCGLPNLGGGAANFSLGATAPGREAFQGRIAEVRYSTFQAGKFDATRDFLGEPAKRPRRPLFPVGPEPDAAAHTLQTRHAKFGLDDKGFLISITSLQTGKQYCPGKHPSAVMSLHESGQPNDKLLKPVSAKFDFDKHVIELKYANGVTAMVKAEAKDSYLRFQLLSLEPRGTVDNIGWGPINTKIAGRIGDLLGVVRDDDWAIGLYGLDDNTISGPVVDGDCYTMGYFIHSADPENPAPRKYKEGQWFNIGGDGVHDGAYNSLSEEYFQYVCGTGAKVEPEYGSSVAYHARDRSQPQVHCWSLLAGFERFRARHVVADAIPGVDYIGSSVALYACPDALGLDTLEQITLGEKLPYVTDRDGIWIRDPASYRATVYWNGPVDKAIEYTKALGFKDISRDTGEFYPSLDKKWEGGVGFSNGRTMSYKEFGELAHQAGLTHGGLHTLCLFLQGGISHEVTPVPSEHLQTVCRTKLAKDISATDTEIVVTDPSFLAEKGTWQVGDDSNYLRIGGEMLRYDGVSESAPWTLRGVKRGHASQAAPHKAGDEVAKLMQNCYNGFAPDMTMLLQYADYYADLMIRNNMDTIDFDGFESTMYQHHGYYATRTFCRRLFERYHKRSGGKWPRLTTSNVFPGSWEYLNACNVGGGGLDPVIGRRGIQAKDLGNGWSNSYYPATFGKLGWSPQWSLYDAENLEAKAVGWDATYAIHLSQDVLERTGEFDAIATAFRAWQEARRGKVFSKKVKQKLRDPDFKFHLEKVGGKLVLYPVRELRGTSIFNPYDSQPLQCAFKFAAASDGFRIVLPDGQKLQSDRKMQPGEFVICKSDQAYIADIYRKKIADLPGYRPAKLPQGESAFTLESGHADLTVWALDKGEPIGE